MMREERATTSEERREIATTSILSESWSTSLIDIGTASFTVETISTESITEVEVQCPPPDDVILQEKVTSSTQLIEAPTSRSSTKFSYADINTAPVREATKGQKFTESELVLFHDLLKDPRNHCMGSTAKSISWTSLAKRWAYTVKERYLSDPPSRDQYYLRTNSQLNQLYKTQSEKKK